MNIRQDESASIAVMKKASSQLKDLKSEIALAYAQATSNNQAAVKAKKLALSKIEAIEKEVRGGLDKYVKMVR